MLCKCGCLWMLPWLASRDPVVSESPVYVQLLSRLSLSQGLGLCPIPLWITRPQVRGSTEVCQVPFGLAASALRLGSPPFTWGPAQRKGEVGKDLYWALM